MPTPAPATPCAFSDLARTEGSQNSRRDRRSSKSRADPDYMAEMTETLDTKERLLRVVTDSACELIAYSRQRRLRIVRSSDFILEGLV